MKQQIRNIIQASIDTKQQILQDEALVSEIEKVAIVVTEAFRKGNKVLLCGNGGSAADAQHIAAEFSGRFYSDRDPLPSEALHCNTSYLTAVGNDYGFEYVYSRMIKGMGKSGDILIGLSTSGNSVNIINAMEEAKKIGMIIVGFTGKGGKMKDLCDHCINVPSTDTPRIQEAHIMVGHIMCQLVEEQLFSKD
jgi:D-sedoheptulose 7-phosphate isomerase